MSDEVQQLSDNRDNLTREKYEAIYTKTYNLLDDNSILIKDADTMFSANKVKHMACNVNIARKFLNGLTRPISFLVFAIVTAIRNDKTSVKQKLFYREGFFYAKGAEFVYKSRHKLESLKKDMEKESYLSTRPSLIPT